MVPTNLRPLDLCPRSARVAGSIGVPACVYIHPSLLPDGEGAAVVMAENGGEGRRSAVGALN